MSLGLLSCSSHSLTDAQRDALLLSLERDGFAVLPLSLPPEDVALLAAATMRLADEARAARAAAVTTAPPGGGSSSLEPHPPPPQRSVKISNVVDKDAAFLELALYPPALQLAHDAFGSGMFHLNQSNVIARPREAAAPRLDFVSGSPWHSDGPRPCGPGGSPFPSPSGAGGAVGLHYLKFGFFFSDLRHGDGGSLQVVRGSHLRRELDGKGGALAGAAAGAPDDGGGATVGAFDPREYAADLVQLDVPAGAIVAFHQAQWHAAMPNESDVERLNAYVSYCPTWMRPVDREFPAAEELRARGLGAEARWLLGEPRPAMRWWIPSAEDLTRMARFARDGGGGRAATYSEAIASAYV